MFSRRRDFSSAGRFVEFPLWGQGRPNVEVAGENHYSSAIAALFPGPLPANGSETTRQAHLVPEPSNRYDRNAVEVVIDGQRVGYLPKELARRYQPAIVQLNTRGFSAVVDARIWARPEVEYAYDRRGNPTERRTGHLHARVTLALAAPHLISPLNEAPGGVEIPPGKVCKLTADESTTQACLPWLRPEGEAWVYLTLHRVSEELSRSTRDLVEGRIDGSPVGRLSPTTSKHYLPLLEALDQRGIGCVARGMVKGNRVKADVSLHALRSSELSTAWLDANVDRHPVIKQQGPRQDAAAEPEAVQTDDRAAGWYPDPQEIAPLRYWDGTEWTSRIKMN